MTNQRFFATFLLVSTAALSPTLAFAQAAPLTADQKIEMLAAQVESLQKQVAELKAQTVKATPTWKGAPQFNDAGEGWSFKPRSLAI